MFSLLKQLAYEIDLLKTPFLLYINGKPKSSTIFGSLFSILILFLLCISFFQSNMIQKINPYISEKVIRYSTSPNITFKNNNGIFASLVDFYRESYVDKSIFTIEAKILVQNGSNKINEKILNLRQCTIQDLEKKNAKEFNASKIFCLDENEFSIFGSLDENYISLLHIYLRLCNNKTDGIICKKETEIVDFLKNKIFILGYSDYSFDMENYENPYQIRHQFKLNQLHFKSKDVLRINFKKVLFYNDDNWFIRNEKQENEKEDLFMVNYEVNQNTDILDLMTHNTFENPLSSYEMLSCKDVQIFSRRYQKLQEVLANISGLANSLIFFGVIIVKLFTHLKLISFVNNSLLNFDPDSKEIQMKLQKSNIHLKKYEKNCKIEMNKNEINTNNEIEEQEFKKLNDNSELNKKKSNLDIFPYFFEFFIFLYKLNRPFFTIFEYIKIKFKIMIKKKLNKKENTILEAENFYKNEIDIIFILKKLQELEYLKKVLLSPAENSLFFLLINKKNNRSDFFPDNKMNFDYLENYKLLLKRESKTLININFLELLNKNIENYENLIKI